MKKILYSLVVCGVLSSAFFYKPVSSMMNRWFDNVLYFSQKKVQEVEEKKIQSFFKTKRDIPETINLGAFWAGITAKGDGNFDKSSFYLRKVHELDPENDIITKQLYFLEGISGKIDQLTAFFTNDLKKDNEFFFAPYVKIVHAIKNKNYQQAKALLLLDTEKTDKVYTYPLLAWVYAGLGDKENALLTLNKMEEDAFSKHTRLYHTALILDYFGEYSLAEKSYNEIASLPNIASWTALVSGKEFFERRKKWNFVNGYLLKYTKILSETPLLKDIIEQVGMSPIKTPQEGASEIFYSWGVNTAGQHEAAAFIVNLSLFLNNKHSLAKIWLAESYERLEYFSAAHKIYDELWEASNRSDIILYKKGNLYLKEKKIKEALAVFNELEKRNKNNFVLSTLIANSYKEIGDCKSALPFYEKTIYLLEKMGVSNFKDVYFDSGTCYLQENKFDSFEKNMRTCLKLDPNDANVLNYLAYAWLEKDINIDEAVIFLEKANELLPNSPEIMDSLALAYYKKARYEDALVFAEKAVDGMGASSVANMHLGDIYKALGRYRESISQYEKALALKFDLTPELEKELLERLK